MNLRVRILHLSEGIAALGARMSIASGYATETNQGVPRADRIEMHPAGYLIAHAGRLYLVPHAKVLAAEVEDTDAPPVAPEEPPRVLSLPRTPPPPTDAEMSAKAAKEERERAAAAKARSR